MKFPMEEFQRVLGGMAVQATERLLWVPKDPAKPDGEKVMNPVITAPIAAMVAEHLRDEAIFNMFAAQLHSNKKPLFNAWLQRLSKNQRVHLILVFAQGLVGGKTLEQQADVKPYWMVVVDDILAAGEDGDFDAMTDYAVGQQLMMHKDEYAWPKLKKNAEVVAKFFFKKDGHIRCQVIPWIRKHIPEAEQVEEKLKKLKKSAEKLDRWAEEEAAPAIDRASDWLEELDVQLFDEREEKPLFPPAGRFKRFMRCLVK